MKKKILLFILLSFCIKINAQTKIIKANPLGLAFGIANLGIEISGKRNQTTTISALYYSESELNGYGVGLEQRFYFISNKALRGFHAGPSVGYLKLNDNYNDDYNVFSIGAEIGHQWFLNNSFTLDVFSGVGFLVGSVSNLEEISLSVGLSLGYAW